MSEETENGIPITPVEVLEEVGKLDPKLLQFAVIRVEKRKMQEQIRLLESELDRVRGDQS